MLLDAAMGGRNEEQANRDDPETTIHVSGLTIVARGLPTEAGEWTFTEHALERMRQRHINPIAALRAVCAPKMTRGAGEVNLEIREAGGVTVVVTLNTKEIVTVIQTSKR